MIKFTTLATGSKGNCYHITDGSTKLLLEIGINFKNVQKALNFNTKDIQGVLVSHEHKDHCAGINEALKRGLDIYMSKGTKEALNLEHHRVKVVESKKQFRIGTWTILPFDVQHDVECLGYLLINQQGERLLFATDTYYIKYKFNNLNLIAIECNYSMDILDKNIAIGRVHPRMKNRLIKSHFSLENVKEFFKANDLSQVQEIHLLHLSDTNSDEELFKREIQELTGKLVFVP